MRIDIITASYNRPSVVRAIQSVQDQRAHVRQIVVDGASAKAIVRDTRIRLRDSDILISEPDHGVYDALNKGLTVSDADVVGLLHSDDVFADSAVIGSVRALFEQTGADVVYGDLSYVTDRGVTVRTWRPGPFHPYQLSLGWMPPHPTVFLRRHVIDRAGLYDPTFRIAGDYEYMLRVFGLPGLDAAYLPRTITLMRTGGISNGSLLNVICKSMEDIRAMRRHDIPPGIALPMKNLRKLPQFVLSALSR